MDYKKTEQEYWNKGILYNLATRIYHRSKGERIVIDMEIHDHYNSHWTPKGFDIRRYPALDRTDRWSNISPEELQRSGYKKVTGLYDSIIWWGVPVYIQIYGGKKFDIRERNDQGELLYSQDSAATLHDFMQSKATMNFIKGMSKTSLPSMDLQKLGMIAILGAGAVFGMYMLGVF